MVDAQHAAIEAATRSGALSRYSPALEEGELANRMLWMRPDIAKLIDSGDLEPEQRERVKATLKRFVLGGPFTVVTADSPHKEVSNLGDIRELKGATPPFIELRFRPPKHDLRMFGRFVGQDQLILTSYGMKSPQGKTGMRRLSVSQERGRCDSFFAAQKFDLQWVPKEIQQSVSKATFA